MPRLIVIAILLMGWFGFAADAPPATPPAQAPLKLGDVVFFANFDSTDALKDWQPSGEGKASLVSGYTKTMCLLIESPKSMGSKLRVKLPAERIAGQRLRLSALIKTQEVKPPPQPWQGVKLMLYTRGASGQRWQSPDRLWGTFEFKPVGFSAIVPRDTTEAWLYIGIENTTGKVWFEDVKIDVAGATRQRPSEPAPEAPLDRRTDLPRLRGVMYGPQGKEEDLKVLSQWKANQVRWQLHWVERGKHDLWRNNLPGYDQWLNAALDHLDTMLPVCEKLGIKVLIDLHTPPGGGITIGAWPLFEEKQYQEHFLKTWEMIAQRYKGNKTVWGYDLANEPVEGRIGEGCKDWRELALAACRRIRAIDADHALIVEPGPGGGWDNLEFMEPLPVPGVIYSPHMYVPGDFTHQGVNNNPTGIKYPGEIRGKRWDKEALKKALAPVRQYQLDYNVPIYIGEFSAIRWAPGESARNYLADCIDIFEEYGWDWAYHAFREWDGWSVEHGPDPNNHKPSATPTSRQKLLMDWFAKNQRAER